MVRLREIPRTAAFAWSPGAGLPFIVTGTRAGAVDADFSDETKLELWDLSLDNLKQGVELQPIASINTDSRFHDIAWAPSNPDHPNGIIAGALENGTLDLWNAEKLINGADDPFMSRTTKHSGAIKSLQFNPLKPQILATAGTKGELYIYDVNDIANPFRLGTAVARSDDLECVAWNRKVAHILATGGSGGFVTVWDLKTKKASLTLNNNRKAVGAIAWDPNNPTKLLTATPDDSTPAILLWDLRNSNAPERVLQGHDQGVLSLSWCQQDSDLLLSCGKDNRTLCWNPQTGERLGEFPEVTNWTFQTQFHPHNPNLSATASFDGKIAIQTLQNTNPSTGQATSQGPADGEDFFTKAQTHPQGASFTLLRAPKWLESPVGASFGFGGKLVSFHLQKNASRKSGSTKIQISQFSVDSDVGIATESFEKALKTGDIDTICEEHIAQAKTEEEKADWRVIKTLIANDPRKHVIKYLGFSEADETSNGVNESESAASNGEQKGVEIIGDKQKKDGEATVQSRLSTFFSDGAEQDDFLSDLASTKGAKTDNPFKIYSESDSASDRQITKALLLGQFEKAMMICLKEDRMADAFMIANYGGHNLIERAQAEYLSRKAQGPNYLRLLASMIGKNLWDVVYNADLGNWRESMATLCTYANINEFPDLCEALGDRILESGSRKDASFCYLIGSKLEKVIGIWILELQENEQASMKEPTEDSTFSVHARSLQNFIEKVTVFRDVTKFQDKEQGVTSGWRLAPLYDRYIEYADIVAAHGHLGTAEKYLNLLPAQYPAADVARSRVKLASRTAAPQANVRQQQLSMARSAPRAQPIVGYQPQQAPATSQTPTVASPYIPSGPAVSNLYSPSNTSTYTPQQSYLPSQQQQGYGNAVIPPPMGYIQSGLQNSFGAPPRNTAPSVPPPSRAKDMTNWNDTPMVTKPTISRRGTPSTTPAPITSPFPNQQNLVMPPSAPPHGATRGSPTPPPPPPKGSAPPRMTSPLSTDGPNMAQQPVRASSISNTYAPPLPQIGQQFGQGPPQLTIARGPSPYNPPPTGAPPPSRYTPSTVALPYPQASIPQSQIAPPPKVGNRAPPSSGPYAPQQPPQSSQGPYTPVQSSYQPQQGASQLFQSQDHGQQTSVQQPQPPQQSTGSRPSTGQSQPSKGLMPTTSKYPPGDRSHIPANAQHMVSIFNNDMQRVAGKAPLSYANQVKDTQKRLNILFDHLNNEDLLKPDTVERLNILAQALQSGDYDTATRMQVDIQRDKFDECGNWMVGVKRLVAMSKVTPQ